MCGRIILGSSSDHPRIILGSVPHCKWAFNCFSCMCGRQNSIVICNCIGSFPHCKLGCKWCWWMSCPWSFGGSLARNASLRDSRCTKPYVFPYKVCPRTSMIYLCGATGARWSRVWSDHPRIILGSSSDHPRIGLGSVPHCQWGFNCFSCMCGLQNYCDLQL